MNNQPSRFEEMTRRELQAYVLQHRDDDAAFQVLADRLYASPTKRQIVTEEDWTYLQEKVR